MKMRKLYWTYKISPAVQESLKKESTHILVTAPHTSFIDGVHAAWMLTVMKLVKKEIRESLKGKKVRIAMKKEMFPKGFDWLLKKVFIPVDRKNPRKFWNDIKTKEENFVIGFAPEGTRKKAEVWKSGFLRAAEGSNSPIILGVLDYSKKVAQLLEVIPQDEFLTDGKLDSEKLPAMADKIRKTYENVSAKNPDQFVKDFKIKVRGQLY